MMTRSVLLTTVVLFGISTLPVWANESPAAQADVQKKPSLVRDVYPGLASNSLTYAKLSDLPAGVLLKAQGVTLTDKDVAGEIAKVPQEMQAQLQKNAFFMLENLATRQLLVALARAKTAEPNAALASDEKQLIQTYLKGLAASVQASDAEVAKFYEENKDACGGADPGPGEGPVETARASAEATGLGERARPHAGSAHIR